MAVDPCFTALLADRRNELRPPPPHVTLAELRQANRDFLTSPRAPAVHAVDEVIIAGPGGPLAVRVYRPSAETPLPAAAFFHGGGFVLGDLDTHDYLCRRLAIEAGCVIVATDYRLAPETRYPGAIEDCHAALAWIAGNGAALGVDAGRLAVCGDSAGANLAVATALLARGRGPALRHMALLYPMADAACDSPSMRDFARGYLLTDAAVRWFWEQYLADAAGRTDPLASVLRADLAGLPPTTLLTAEFDPLRDEGEALAARLDAAGVPVTATRHAGMIHGFVGMPQLTPVADVAIGELATGLSSAYRVGCIRS